MVKEKITYELVINRLVKGKKYYFSYGSTRNIALSVTKSGALISVQMTKDYSTDPEQGRFLDVIKECVKRTALVYLLQYQEPLQISTISLSALKNQQKTIIKLPDSLVFYQMFDKKLCRSVGDEWKSPELLQKILQHKKSGNELSRPISALYAYLFSKTKNKETERFTYLWIAMNGFFASISQINKDRDAMSTFLKKYDIGKNALIGKEREKICRPVAFELNKIPEPVTPENLEDEAHKPFSDYFRKMISKYNKSKFDSTPYGFLLTDFPYYLRCTLFHAVHPIELFSFENDWELKCIRIVNGLLENFLDNHLHTLFQNKG